MHSWTEADFVGGDTALDFINTVSDLGKERTVSRIGSWEELEAWVVHAGLDPAHCSAVSGPRIRKTLLAELHTFRELAYRVLSAAPYGDEPDASDLRRLAGYFRAATRAAVLRHDTEGFGWQVGTGGEKALLHLLVLQTEALLRSPDAIRIRECGRCSWLFLDSGRGRGRRWCAMNKCGNRSKVEKFRHSDAVKE